MYKFIHVDEDGTEVSVSIGNSITHFEVTEAYIQFLRACGFAVPMMSEPNVMDMTDDHNPAH